MPRSRRRSERCAASNASACVPRPPSRSRGPAMPPTRRLRQPETRRIAPRGGHRPPIPSSTTRATPLRRARQT
ncbi:hypothetical protein EFN18_00855 [Propionibacterium freudenreichii]|nr:hypothetical protein [Propionibacterium freudenreichii]